MKPSIVILGATGAVGSASVEALINNGGFDRLSLVGRRPLSLKGFKHLNTNRITQHTADIFEPSSYRDALAGHDVAICTLGVGQPSKMSKADFLRIDKTAVLDFARECKAAGVKHFQMLTSIGSSASSKSFYLRSKGELENELRALQFDQLSLFQPSMILTQSNRYGLSQALTLAVWPIVSHLMIGNVSKYRGIKVATLGKAIANNSFALTPGVQCLQWIDFIQLAENSFQDKEK